MTIITKRVSFPKPWLNNSPGKKLLTRPLDVSFERFGQEAKMACYRELHRLGIPFEGMPKVVISETGDSGYISKFHVLSINPYHDWGQPDYALRQIETASHEAKHVKRYQLVLRMTPKERETAINQTLVQQLKNAEEDAHIWIKSGKDSTHVHKPPFYSPQARKDFADFVLKPILGNKEVWETFLRGRYKTYDNERAKAATRRFSNITSTRHLEPLHLSDQINGTEYSVLLQHKTLIEESNPTEYQTLHSTTSLPTIEDGLKWLIQYGRANDYLGQLAIENSNLKDIKTENPEILESLLKHHIEKFLDKYLSSCD